MAIAPERDDAGWFYFAGFCSIALAPRRVDGLERLDLVRVPLGGELVDFTLRLDGERALADVTSLPRGGSVSPRGRRCETRVLWVARPSARDYV
jgi:hypothetical protein